MPTVGEKYYNEHGSWVVTDVLHGMVVLRGESGSKQIGFDDLRFYNKKPINPYGYICMTCGKTIPGGVNKDGECKNCALGRRPTRPRGHNKDYCARCRRRTEHIKAMGSKLCKSCGHQTTDVTEFGHPVKFSEY